MTCWGRWSRSSLRDIRRSDDRRSRLRSRFGRCCCRVLFDPLGVDIDGLTGLRLYASLILRHWRRRCGERPAEEAVGRGASGPRGVESGSPTTASLVRPGRRRPSKCCRRRSSSRLRISSRPASTVLCTTCWLQSSRTWIIIRNAASAERRTWPCRDCKVRLPGGERQGLCPATTPNEVWDMDFVNDALRSGCRIKCLEMPMALPTRLWTSQSIAASVGLRGSVAGSGGRRASCAVLRRCAPMTSARRTAGSSSPGHSAQHRTPVDQAGQADAERLHRESFNSKFRDECLNEHWFTRGRSPPNWRRKYKRGLAPQLLWANPAARFASKYPAHATADAGTFNLVFSNYWYRR